MKYFETRRVNILPTSLQFYGIDINTRHFYAIFIDFYRYGICFSLINNCSRVHKLYKIQNTDTHKQSCNAQTISNHNCDSRRPIKILDCLQRALNNNNNNCEG